MKEKTKKIVEWVLTIFVALVLVASGLFKLFGERTPEMEASVGGATNMLLLGVLEITIVLLWLLPRTGVVGALLAIAYLGGAIAVHFTTGQSILVPVVIQIIVWITAVIRFPELGHRLFGNNK